MAEGRAGVPAHDEAAPYAALAAVLDGSIPARSSAPRRRRRSTPPFDSWTRISRARRCASSFSAGTTRRSRRPRLPSRNDPRDPRRGPRAARSARTSRTMHPTRWRASSREAGVLVAIGNGQTPMAAARTRDLPNDAAMAAVVRARPARGPPGDHAEPGPDLRRGRADRLAREGKGRVLRPLDGRSPPDVVGRDRVSGTRAWPLTSRTATSGSGSAIATGRSRVGSRRRKAFGWNRRARFSSGSSASASSPSS